MKNLQALRDKAQSSDKLVVTAFLDGDVVKELNKGWGKIYLSQNIKTRSNAGTAILTNERVRTAFVNISPSDMELYSEYLTEGTDFNEILDAIGETKKVIVHQLAKDSGFYPTQKVAMYKDSETGEMVEQLTKDGDTFYNRGVLGEVGDKDVWGSNELDTETGYTEFSAFEVEDVIEEVAPKVKAEQEPLGASRN